MVNAGTADYAVGTANYWDDIHIQEVLDRHRVDVYRELLTPRPSIASGGTPVYQDYLSQYHNFEQTSGGTAIFFIEDGTGADSGTANWSADYQRGIVTFVANQAGTAYYLTGRAFDLYGAAADIWRMKASYFAEQFDFSTDNHSISRSQRVKQAMQMAEMYQAKATGSGENTTTLYRSDVWPAQ